MGTMQRRYRLFFLVVLLLAILIFAVPAAFAIDFNAKQMILKDVTTDTVLLERDEHAQMFPSSMSKLMTLYVLFEKLKAGGITLESTFPVSEKAWRMQGSKMFVQVGTDVKVEDLIQGIIVQSGNDACVVVAETLGGSEEGFADMLNEAAKKMGLKGSHFMNATGWPDENHYMTAADLSILGQRLMLDFPEYYHYFSEAEFTYSGITQPNRNLLLARDLGVDGLKTGHTEIAGFGIVLSANKDNRRLVLVVNGLSSMAERAKEGELLLRHGFRDYEAVELLNESKSIASIPVFYGDQDEVKLTVPKAVMVTIPRGNREGLTFTLHHNDQVQAPIAKGAPLGTLDVEWDGKVRKSIELVAAESVKPAGFMKRLGLGFHHFTGL